MGNKLLSTFVLVFLLALLAGPSAAQFGRNKIQYRHYDWQVLTTPHFEIHFYDGEEAFAQRAALVMEDGYRMLSNKLNETLPWKVPVILYGSHNDFLENNVSLELLSEGVQAFAEPSRKRIVLPFTGSYQAFEHTAIHELAHVFTFQIVYNRLLDNVFSRNALFGMPLWIAEGVAEYLAVGWDTDSDMFIRDAVIHDYLPDLTMTSGFFNYKGGQSVFNYIERTYGREKVLEILDALAVTRSADGALERTIGLSTEELSAKWKKEMRKHYWPMYGDKAEVSELGRRLTNHIKDRAYYNTKPVLSPDGERIAYFSDRDGLISIYVMSTIDGKIVEKLVTGYRSNRFESLHFFTSSLCWSPDGESIAFVAKSDGKSQLYIVDSDNGDVQLKIEIRADGLSSPTWSPDGELIVASAVYGGQTDLVAVNVRTADFERLTNDVADQLHPRFFPDGKRVVFAYYPEVTAEVPGDVSAESRRILSEMDFLATDNVRHGVTADIYEYDLETRLMRPVVDTGGDDSTPVVFDDNRKMFFTSDASGIRNLYVADLETGEYRRITDVLSGFYSPDVCVEKNRLVFSAFVKGGWDVYASDELDEFLEQNFEGERMIAFGASKARSRVAQRGGQFGPDIPIARYLAMNDPKPGRIDDDDGEEVFSLSDVDSLKDIDAEPMLARGMADPLKPRIDVSRRDDSDGAAKRVIEGVNRPVLEDEPVTRGASVGDYKLKLAPDFIGQGGLYYSTGLGFGLANTIAMSDLLGNHRMVFSFSLYRDIADSDVLGVYYYLARRIDYGIGAFQFKNFLNSRVTSVGEAFTDYRLFTERNYGVFGLVSVPFTTFNRLEFQLQAFVSERQFFDEAFEDPTTNQLVLQGGDRDTRNLIEPAVAYVHDATFYNYFGPVDGSRYRISMSKGFGLGEEAVERSSFFLDYRKYMKVFYRNSFAFRLAAAASEGQDPRTFFLGGPSTLRGYSYLAFDGSRLVVTSLEYRFPLIDALIFGWPGRWGFQNLGGSVFFDAGAAWDKGDFHPFRTDVNGLQFDDVLGAVGFGTHFYFGYFLLNFQWGWQTDLRSIGHSRFHFYLGPSF